MESRFVEINMKSAFFVRNSDDEVIRSQRQGEQTCISVPNTFHN